MQPVRNSNSYSNVGNNNPNTQGNNRSGQQNQGVRPPVPTQGALQATNIARPVEQPAVPLTTPLAAQANVPAATENQTAGNQTSGIRQSVNLSDVKLTNLKVNPNEKGRHLVMIPSALQAFTPGHNYPRPQDGEPRDRDYFESIYRNGALPAAFRLFVGGAKLRQNTELTPEQVQSYENKVRYIEHRLNIAKEQGNEDVAHQVYELSNQARTNCIDRTAFYMGEMVIVAYADELASGDRPGTDDLFNLGVAFYKLHRTREVVRDIVRENSKMPLVREIFGEEVASRGFSLDEEVETYLQAEYKLKDLLGLPVDHTEPVYGCGNSILTEIGFEDVAKVVDADLLENDAEKLFDFMGAWAPWVHHLETAKDSTPIGYDFDESDFDNRLRLGDNFKFQTFTDEMGRDLTMNSVVFKRKALDQIYHKEMEGLDDMNLSEGEYNRLAKETMRQHDENKAVLYGQIAKEFLLGERAGHLIEDLGREIVER